jgi:hypothetical protein
MRPSVGLGCSLRYLSIIGGGDAVCFGAGQEIAECAVGSNYEMRA